MCGAEKVCAVGVLDEHDFKEGYWFDARPSIVVAVEFIYYGIDLAEVYCVVYFP